MTTQNAQNQALIDELKSLRATQAAMLKQQKKASGFSISRVISLLIVICLLCGLLFPPLLILGALLAIAWVIIYGVGKLIASSRKH